MQSLCKLTRVYTIEFILRKIELQKCNIFISVFNTSSIGLLHFRTMTPMMIGRHNFLQSIFCKVSFLTKGVGFAWESIFIHDLFIYLFFLKCFDTFTAGFIEQIFCSKPNVHSQHLSVELNCWFNHFLKVQLYLELFLFRCIITQYVDLGYKYIISCYPESTRYILYQRTLVFMRINCLEASIF